jgi:hypothetical protein
MMILGFLNFYRLVVELDQEGCRICTPPKFRIGSESIKEVSFVTRPFKPAFKSTPLSWIWDMSASRQENKPFSN